MGPTSPLNDPDHLRAWWWHRQGLDGSLSGSTAHEVLERSGWARSVGGSGPYLTLFSRAGLSRAAVDRAVAETSIHELPSARGCTYVLPAADFALGLAVGAPFAEAPMRPARSLGVTDAEVETLCQAILQILGPEPMDPDALRTATGSASRSLGEAGKKKGVNTTLPLALGLLQARGEIRRVPVNGRLDQQRYAYVRWTPNPLAQRSLPPAEALTELARRYFRWIGPATVKEFQAFAGCGVKAAQAAVAPLALAPIAPGSERALLPEDSEAFHAFRAPAKPRYALVSSLDALLLLRRDLPSHLDVQDVERQLQGERGLLTIGALAELPYHAILDRGRLVGLWDFDPATSSIAWMTFGATDAALRHAVGEMETFVRDELGDARSFSLDSPASRSPRIAWLRSAHAGLPFP